MSSYDPAQLPPLSFEPTDDDDPAWPDEPTAAELTSYALAAEDRDCRVYWGSHGCLRERGHRGRHLSGHPDTCPPGFGKWWRVFGEDIPRALRVWKWLFDHPGGHYRLWWRVRHQMPWPTITRKEWERRQGVPWPYE